MDVRIGEIKLDMWRGQPGGFFGTKYVVQDTGKYLFSLKHLKLFKKNNNVNVL